MPIYESIVILDSLLSVEEIDKMINRIKDMIEGEKGKIISIDKWGKRRLAYDIQKKQYGFYVAIVYEGEGTVSVTLEKEYNFNDTVLRYLTYRFDKNKLKMWNKEKEKKEKKVIEKSKDDENITQKEPVEQVLSAEDDSTDQKEVKDE